MITKELMEEWILEKNESYSTIGKRLGISDNAVKKRARKLGIKLPQRRQINEKESFSHPRKKSASFVFSLTDEAFKDAILNSSTWVEISKKLGYKCKCMSPQTKSLITNRCSMLGVELQLKVKDSVSSLLKGKLFADRKNWQSARTAIQKDARKVFFSNIAQPSCIICGYSKHVEVAHKKAVSDFSDDTPVSEINSIENLIALCPNHHWEYDNGILKI